MIFLVVADDGAVRKEYLKEVLNTDASFAEYILHDDANTTIADLEQYLYPSLFSLTPPVVHSRFILDESVDGLTTELLKKLTASPTMFVFEEMTLRAPVVTQFKKVGAVVKTGEKKVAKRPAPDIFAVTGAITGKDRKERWIAYQKALKHHAIEAIVGILYWKLRDLIAKGGGGKDAHLALYQALLHAHARAWQTGTPLALAIEKVILSS